MEVAYPFFIDHSGQVGNARYDEHIREMIEQLLFTSPGERVNRPDLGCAILQLVFRPESIELIAATRVLVQSSLERWLGDRIRVEAVNVDGEESSLIITIEYVVLRHGGRRVAKFRR